MGEINVRNILIRLLTVLKYDERNSPRIVQDHLSSQLDRLYITLF